MAIRVTLNSVPKNRISVNATRRETVRSVGIAPQTSPNTLEGLSDVDAILKANNNTIVYDAVSEKFVVKTLPIIDGGTF
jgi:hypothetical protein